MIPGLLLAQVGCGDVKPTEEDRRRQLRLQQQYDATYQFRVDDVYLVATRRSGEPTREGAGVIAEAFWSAPSGTLRKDSKVAYLNMHDRAGFRFQAYYDRSTGELRLHGCQSLKAAKRAAEQIQPHAALPRAKPSLPPASAGFGSKNLPDQ